MEIAPSPEPGPYVVKAHHVEPERPTYTKKCSINDEKTIINISILNVNSNINFNQMISTDDLYGTWNEISKYFQNDFTKFYSILDSCFKEENRYVNLNINQNSSKSLTLTFKYEGLFGFTFNIVVNKELDIIDRLSLEIDELKKQNKLLNEKNANIMEILRNHTNWIDEEFIWLELDNLCICQPRDLKRNSNEDYSGEIFSPNEIDKLKDRMIKNRYNACQRDGAGRHYYYKYSWRNSLKGLQPLPSDYTEYTKIYIKIPKDDLNNIDCGLGDTSLDKDEKTIYHGHSRRQGYNENICHNMIVCHGEYIQKWERCKGFKSYEQYYSSGDRNRTRTHNEYREPMDSYKKLFDLRIGNTTYFNIVMPINYYCTNCKKIDEYFPEGKGQNKPGWEIFRCLGH